MFFGILDFDFRLVSFDQHMVNTDPWTRLRDRPVLSVRGRERCAVAEHPGDLAPLAVSTLTELIEQ